MSMQRQTLLVLFCVLPAFGVALGDDKAAEWKPLFNGKDLDGWTPKIKGYELGDNYADTFRVEDGILKVALRQVRQVRRPSSATSSTRTSSRTTCCASSTASSASSARAGPAGRSATAASCSTARRRRRWRKDQEFPRLDRGPVPRRQRQGRTRPTGNVCSPGTNIVMDGKLITQHCNSSKSKTFHGDQWVTAEIEVHGGGKVKHIVNGETVLEYEQPQLDPKRRGREEADQGRQAADRGGLHRAAGREPPDRVPQGGDQGVGEVARAIFGGNIHSCSEWSENGVRRVPFC